MDKKEKEFPLISIIIPVYNVEKYLDRCVSTILNQTYRNLEIILVDDGSPDNSPQKCDNYASKDSRVKVIHKKNGGLSDARNVGIEAATGQYINFVDSDDWMSLDAIMHLYQILLKYDADFAMAQNIRCSDFVNISNNDSSCLLSQRDFFKKLFKDGTQENVQYAWAKLYKKELFNKVRYPVGLTQEDVPTTFEVVLNSKRIAYSNKIVYFYFLNDKSITGKNFNENRFDLLKVWQLIVNKSDEYGCDDWIKYQAKLNYYRAQFGVLTNLAMADLSNTERKKYDVQKNKLIKSLKKHRKVLLKSNIPNSRKALIIMYCVSYDMSRIGMSVILKLKKIKEN